MKLKLASIAALMMIQAVPAFGATKKAKNAKPMPPPVEEASLDEEDEEETAEAARKAVRTPRNSKRVAMADSDDNYRESRSEKFITKAGSPAPGRILISPMVGNYALAGLEYGLKGSYQILDHGFIPALNNSISIEAEVFRGEWKGFWLTRESMFYGVSGRWDFHLSRRWTVYGGSGLQIEQSNYRDSYYNDEDWDHETDTDLSFQLGSMYIISDNFRLRGEWCGGNASFRFGGVFAM